MSCCSKIGALLKKVLDALGPILTIALLCFSAYLLIVSAGTGAGLIASMEGYLALPAALVGLSPTTWAFVAIGMAVVISPTTVGAIASGAGEVVGKVTSGVLSAASKFLGGALGGLASGGGGLLTFGLISVGLYFLFGKKGNDEEPKDTTTVKAVVKPDVPDQPGVYTPPAYSAPSYSLFSKRSV